MHDPVDYSRPFRLTGAAGNNALAYDRRGPAPSLWVPALVDGTLADVVPGDEIVFEDLDEHGQLHACRGLRHLVRTTWDDVPTVIVDNHNHAFYFWCEALAAGVIGPGAALVHLDQHRDTRTPSRFLPPGAPLDEVFRYTNFELNVGNYVPPAQQAGVIGDILFATGESALHDLSMAGSTNTILNIDLDFFAPEMASIDFELTRRFIDAHRSTASLITVATSPFFIDQDRAIDYLHRLMRA